MKKYALAPDERWEQASQQEELHQLKAEFKRFTEKRDSSEKIAAIFANDCRYSANKL